jgi:cytochrome P450
MSNAPIHEINVAEFTANPYADLTAIREGQGAAFVPQLNATLFCRRDTIHREEKRVDLFSSRQPEGLMVKLMGENMLRKDGDEHAADKKATFPSYSPRTVRDHWSERFRSTVEEVIEDLRPQGGCDLVHDYAMRVSGEALRDVTGLYDLSWKEIDQTSQAMIDGVANYHGDPQLEQNARDAVARINQAVERQLDDQPEFSLLKVQLETGMPLDAAAANIRLAISGGQNEPRDAIAGAAWALLTHPEQLELIREGQASWKDAFEEFNRWQSPVGMVPREVTRDEEVEGIMLNKGDRVFFMYSGANRDPRVFDNPEVFDVTRNTAPSLAFGAGPHFCAGAAVSRTLVSEMALPMLFEAFPNLRLDGDVRFHGWAFRGPVNVKVRWD